MQPYELITGVGRLYIAPVGTAFPDLDDTPGAAWRDMGPTEDGVSVNLDQKIDEHRVDQETGPIEATRSEENLTIETTLPSATLENLADVLGGTVEDTAPGAGLIGTREVPLYRGKTVKKFSLLFRGETASSYGEGMPGQYEIPRGYFGGTTGLKDTKDGHRAIGVEFHALVDPSASSDGEKFGRLIMQDAEATS
ncbi:MAG: hypothetical protein CVU42_13875 [Chloroflexi bacterium HGW-Chloroflexi-4]|jgi:hypothetical protein|nr:MAG: hypothetical protein CVU42_13875 [Chloroflexi bacterium HGW-Chloroflexi-4]